MSEVKFKQYKKKHNNGYIETVTIAYFDITLEIKSIFGNIVKNAYQIISEYNEINGTMEDWKQMCYSISINISKNYIDVDNEQIVIIEFINGNIVEFFSSEWGHIAKNNESIF